MKIEYKYHCIDCEAVIKKPGKCATCKYIDSRVREHEIINHLQYAHWVANTKPKFIAPSYCDR